MEDHALATEAAELERAEEEEKKKNGGSRSLSSVAKMALSIFSGFEPNTKSNFVLLCALLQVALLPWVHHLGRPYTPDIGELPVVRGPVIMTLGIMTFLALIEQPQGSERSRLADFMQIHYVPPGLSTRIFFLLAATGASVVIFDSVIRHYSTINNK